MYKCPLPTTERSKGLKPLPNATILGASNWEGSQSPPNWFLLPSARMPSAFLNPEAQVLYTNLLNQKIKVGRQDLRIAAIALSVNGILVTRNNRDFCQVPNLVLDNWTL